MFEKLLTNFNLIEIEETTKKEFFKGKNFIADFIPTQTKILKIENLLKKDACTLFKDDDCDLVKYFKTFLEYTGFDPKEFLSIDKNTYLIKGITKKDLTSYVENIITKSAPLKDVDFYLELIDYLEIKTLPKNNELLTRLISKDPKNPTWNGDDLVRAIIYRVTATTLLIKSKENQRLLSLLEEKSQSLTDILCQEIKLAKVFNRHKKLFLSLKKNYSSQINKISKLSKKFHEPLYQGINKSFIHHLKNLDLSKINTLDLFKGLNAIEALKSDTRFFVIRNGKTFYKENSSKEIDNSKILEELKKRFSHLQNISLPSVIDYGLPISEKQTLGNVPYGTKVISNQIGIHWESENDYDLSFMSETGEKVGWNSNFSNKDVKFSGDKTSGPAYEFITGIPTENGILVNNLYRGELDEVSFVAGVEKNILFETFKMTTRQICLGYYTKDIFVISPMSISDKNVSTNDSTKALFNKIKSKQWTLKELFSQIGVSFIENDSKRYTFRELLEIFGE